MGPSFMLESTMHAFHSKHQAHVAPFEISINMRCVPARVGLMVVCMMWLPKDEARERGGLSG